MTLIGAIAWVLWRLAASDQLEAERWGILFDTESGVPQSLGRALLNTLRAAAVGMVLSMILGAFLAAGRLSDHAWVRRPVDIVVQFYLPLPQSWYGQAIPVLREMVFGAALILVLLFRPSGVLGAMRRDKLIRSMHGD